MVPKTAFYTLVCFVLTPFLLCLAILAHFMPSIIYIVFFSIETKLLTLAVLYIIMGFTMEYIFSLKVPPENKAVLITGCGSGFGHALAKRLDSKGFHVFAGCLNPLSEGAEQLKKSCSSSLHVFGLDITKDKSVQEALNYVKKNLDGMDLWAVVNNAGRAQMFEITWSKMEDFQYVVDVNIMGAIRVTKAFLPLLRKSKGRVVNVSSLAACHPLHITAAYSISKAAISAFSDCLRQEMYPWGVNVVKVEPEFFRTNIINYDVHRAQIEDAFDSLDQDTKDEYGEKYWQEYSAAIQRSFDGYSDQIDNVVDSLEASVILDHPRNVYKPCRNVFVRFIFYLAAFLPEFITDFVVRLAYYKLEFPKPEKAH